MAPSARITDTQRVLLAGTGVGAFLLGIAPLGALSMVFETLVIQFGLGLGLCLLARDRARHRVVLYSLVLGPSLLILPTNLMARYGGWHVNFIAPWWLAATLLSLLAALALGLRDLLSRRQPERQAPPSRGVVLTDALALTGWAIAFVSAAQRPGDPQPSGMALTAGPLWFVGAALITAATIIALIWTQRALAVTVLALTSVVVFSQAVMYKLPTVMVGGRHVGMGVYINHHGALDPRGDIYHAWAGLFASTAFTTRTVGLEEPLTFANWWGAICLPVMVLSVRALAGRWLPPKQSWIASMIFGLGSALTTPFYAPQVFGFIAALTVVVLLAGRRDEHPPSEKVMRIATALAISSALAVTHQLSPYMISVALFVLVVFGILKPWWLPVVILGPAMVWMGFNINQVAHYISPSAFGRVFNNLAPPEHPTPPFGLPWENRLTFLAPAMLLVAIGLLAAWRWWQHSDRRLATALALAAASPVAIMALTDYGSEGIFRVALFALPWLALLAALPAQGHGKRFFIVPKRPGPVLRLATAVSVIAMMAISVVGLTGMDWARVIRQDDVNAVRYYELNATPLSFLMAPGSQLATPVALTQNYRVLGYFSRDTVIKYFDKERVQIYPLETGDAYDAEADLADMSNLFIREEAPDHYMYWSASSLAYNYRYGLQRPQDFLKIREALDRSTVWTLVYASGESRLYRYTGERPAYD